MGKRSDIWKRAEALFFGPWGRSRGLIWGLFIFGKRIYDKYNIDLWPDSERRMPVKSILIKDTTREEREQIIKNSLDCGGGCENCSSCWLGGGNPWDIYQDYIDGKKEIREINMEYMEKYRQDRQIH